MYFKVVHRVPSVPAARTVFTRPVQGSVVPETGERPLAAGSQEKGQVKGDVMSAEPAAAKRPKYLINIEGTEHPWNKDTITVPEIRELGNLPATDPVIEVDLKDNTERTLTEDEVVEIKPGKGFGKKVKFQRG
jgi:hypothetical protein